MTYSEKELYIRLLGKDNSELSKALLFYLSKRDCKYDKKKIFIEKVVDQYVKAYSVNATQYEEFVNLSNIPEDLAEKIISKYNEDRMEDERIMMEELSKEFDEIWENTK